MKIQRIYIALGCAALLAACDLFDANPITDLTASAVPTARVKFYNFAPGSVNVNFFANNVKLTAVSSSSCTGSDGSAPTVDSLKAKCNTTGIESTLGVAYGSLSSGGLYDAIAPNSYTFTAKITTTDTVVSTVTQNVADGKFYSMYMSGIYSSAGNPRADAFIVEDPVPAINAVDYTVALVRFVNAIPNGTGDITLFGKIAGGTEAAIGGAVAYKNAGAFVSVTPGVYDLSAKYGTTTVTGMPTLTGQSFRAGFVYTVSARGNTATASTLALNNTSNQR